MKHLSIKKMRVFFAIAKEESFSKGARLINMSQPAASVIVDEIEALAGRDLFVRSGNTRRAQLTEIGSRVAERFSRIISAYDTELDKIASLDRIKRDIHTVLIQRPYASAMSSEWLNCLVNGQREKKVVFRVCDWSDIIDCVRTNHASMGLIDGSGDQEFTDYIQIGTIKLCLVVPYEFDSAHFFSDTVDWADVPTNTVIYSGTNPRTVQRVYKNLENAGRDPDEFIDVNCEEIMAKLISSLHSPCIVPSYLAEALCQRYNVKKMNFANSLIEIPLGFVMPQGRINQIRMSQMKLEAIFPPTGRVPGDGVRSSPRAAIG